MHESETREPISTRRGRGRLIWGVVAAVTLVFLVHTFVAHPFKVEESSMEPNFDLGDWVVIDKLTPSISNYARGDIVLVKSESLGIFSGTVPAHLARIIGLPGDTVDFDNGIVYVTRPDGLRRREGAAPPWPLRADLFPAHWVLNGGEYFVLGDNRPEVTLFLFRRGGTVRDAFEGRVWP